MQGSPKHGDYGNTSDFFHISFEYNKNLNEFTKKCNLSVKLNYIVNCLKLLE